ncbi:MAG: metallophosphoesterase family protein [Gammaproteobacteria bacterium]
MNGSLGVISDTHGLLRPEAVEALRGSELIVHAGDIGKPEVIDELERIAPVVACRGNVDTGDWAGRFAPSCELEFAGRRIHLLHNISELAMDLAAHGFDAVICGHSHKPRVEHHGNVLHLNPGSAGPRRFKLPVSVARIRFVDGSLAAEIVELEVPPPKGRKLR